ncbi:hypothetical protein SteCoe_23274 [Stentor coeruleus]|uniref:ODAD1 central coiled coil region domain-containing protein n=1 Tax=Stentor coeruleus TaxID=5963 RepID=A0A1R2BKB0_9CILI|nr:hypothetical protein SteCoe_23274 [Stentor coeruleus]
MMNPPRLPKMFTRSSLAKESKVNFLEKDIEALTLSLECEKREAAFLEEQIKLMQFELSSLPKPQQNNLNTLKASLLVQEKKLDQEKNTLNQLHYHNKQLRDKIDVYRMEKLSSKQSLNIIKNTIDKTSRIANTQTSKLLKIYESESLQKQKIGMIRSKSVSQSSKYEEKLTTLANFLKNTASKSKILYEESIYQTQGVEAITILKSMVRLFGELTHKKKKSLEAYIKHINNLINGFEEMKKATGFYKVEDIVTACIKSEEQGQAILQYFNMLSIDIDKLDEELKKNTERIFLIEGNKNQGDLNVQGCLDGVIQEYENVMNKVQIKKQEVGFYGGNIQKSLSSMLKMYRLLLTVGFKSNFHTSDGVERIDKLNEENLEVLLGSIEELVEFLIMATHSKMKKVEYLHKLSQGDKSKSQSSQRLRINELIEENDIYEEPELEEIRVPISLEEMRHRAKNIFEKRRNLIKGKLGTAETYYASTSNTALRNDL